jgi:AcrR family transcriptional regulator
MPLKKYHQEDILEAAFKVVRERGWEKCTARAVAAELGASTMPIYTALKGMGNLRDEIAKRASNLLLAYQTKARTDIAFLDMGVGYVLFSQEEKVLFRLMMDIDDYQSTDKDISRKYCGYVFERLEDRLNDDALFEGLSKQQKHDLFYKAWIFTHGLAVLLNNGMIEPMDKEAITRILFESVGAITYDERKGIVRSQNISDIDQDHSVNVRRIPQKKRTKKNKRARGTT